MLMRLRAGVGQTSVFYRYTLIDMTCYRTNSLQTLSIFSSRHLPMLHTDRVEAQVRIAGGTPETQRVVEGRNRR